jgi:hypothetical protein
VPEYRFLRDAPIPYYERFVYEISGILVDIKSNSAHLLEESSDAATASRAMTKLIVHVLTSPLPVA